MLALAAYKLDGGGATMIFEDLVAQVWLSDIEPRNGRRISERLATLTVTQFEEYYKKRYDRTNKCQTATVTLSFDSTSISTSTTTITMRRGDTPNKTRNCVRSTTWSSLPTPTTGPSTTKPFCPRFICRCAVPSYPWKTNILVTDRGFQSIYSTQTAINLKLKYIQFLNLNEGAVRAQLRRNAKALRDPIAHSNPRMGICGIRVADHWTEQTEEGY